MNLNKILIFTHYSSLYGANRSLLLLLDGLRKHKVGLLVIVPEEGDICEILESKRIPYLIFKFHWWCGIEKVKPQGFLKKLSFEIKNKRDIKRSKSFNISRLQILKEKLGDFNPDCCYSNSSVFNFGLLFAKKYDIPHIWHLRELQEHFDFRWYYTFNQVCYYFNASDIVIGISEYICNSYKKKYCINGIEILHNPILSKKELNNLDDLRSKIKFYKGINLTFGIIGLIHPNKGQDDAIKALAIVKLKYPNVQLYIIGMGDQKGLRNLAERKNVIDNIRFYGHIDDPYKLFLKLDVSLMCSRMEGMGRVTLESMSAAVPVIGYKEGGTIELIDNGFNGLFYENDYKDLAEKMIYMIENPIERKKMGKNARNSFEDKYTTEGYTKKFLKILENFENE